MKKFTKLAGLVLSAMLAMGFAGCSSDSDSGTPAEKPPVTSYIGSKAPDAAKAVGDIVFNDGSSTPYTAELTLTDAQKAAAIAVIFKAEGGKVLGVGLKHNRSGLAWCTSGAKAYSTNITTIQCPASGSAGNLTFTVDTDGSDNLEQIAAFLGNENDTTGEGAEERYPAFYFAKNYSTTATNLGTEYASGWYLPTIAELFDVWKVKATVDAASKLCGGSEFGTSWYWSSSQYASFDYVAYILVFKDGDWSNYYKYDYDFCVCCIRAFN